MKKVISSILVIFLLAFGTNVQAAATKQSVVNVGGKTVTISIITDNNNSKVVQTDDGKTITLVNYDKINNSISIKETDKISNKVNITNTKIDTNKISNKVAAYNKTNSIANSNSYTVSTGYSMLWDNGYIFYSDYRWAVWDSVDNYKSVYENSSNAPNLTGLKSAVDSLRGYEVAAIAAAGVTICAAVVAILTAPTGVGAIVGILVVIGGAIGAAVSLWNAYCSRDNADFYWYRVN